MIQKINKEGVLKTGDSSTLSDVAENWELFIVFGILEEHSDLEKWNISKWQGQSVTGMG